MCLRRLPIFFLGSKKTERDNSSSVTAFAVAVTFKSPKPDSGKFDEHKQLDAPIVPFVKPVIIGQGLDIRQTSILFSAFQKRQSILSSSSLQASSIQLHSTSPTILRNEQHRGCGVYIFILDFIWIKTKARINRSIWG